MNVAIIIGVSKYATGNDLPACKNDARKVFEVISKSDKYSNILYLNADENSPDTKKALTTFVSNEKGKEVNELLFYYSGHGEFYKDDFFYLLSDFDSKKRNQTALQNSEVDQLFRSLSPALMVKVIDACQSGTSYIKENEVLQTYLQKTAQQSFKSCYFIYSSLNSQSSYAGVDISHFTASFLNAIRKEKGAAIRYKDVIDVILDDFEGDSQQTPFFVIQADFTEEFLIINDKLTEYFEGKAGSHTHQQISKESTLLQRIKEDASKYSNKEGALRALAKFRELVEGMRLKDDLGALYELNSTFSETYRQKPSKWPVQKWLKEHTNDFFAQPLYSMGFDDETGDDYTILDGFDLKVETDFNEISVDINATLPNLASYHCSIVFFLSKRQIRFFYCLNRYRDINFDERFLDTKNAAWITNVADFADENSLSGRFHEIKSKIEEVIEADLKSRFSSDDDSPF